MNRFTAAAVTSVLCLGTIPASAAVSDTKGPIIVSGALDGTGTVSVEVMPTAKTLSRLKPGQSATATPSPLARSAVGATARA